MALLCCAPPLAAQRPIHVFLGEGGGDRLGASAAGAGDVDGDGVADVIIGAHKDDNNGSNSGSARVCSGVDGRVLYLFNGESPDDQLGFSVDGAGDANGDGYDDLVVGVPGDDNQGSASGAVRVFSGRDGSTLHAFDGDGPGDVFGSAVAGIGDLNADGYDDFGAGAPQRGAPGGAGYVKLYSGVDGSLLWTFVGDSPGDSFGHALAGAGDVDRDGHDDVIVGALLDDNNGASSGSARVFSGRDGRVLFTFYGDGPGDTFGTSVDGAGDVDGDGVPDLIVGAPGDDNTQFDAGSARVFSGRDGRVLYTLDGQFAGDSFGWSVAGVGDFDGDGAADILVASPWHDGPALDGGAATVFAGSHGGTLCFVRGRNAGDWLGFSAAAAGDVDCDGLTDVVLGAMLQDNGTLVDAGAATVIAGGSCKYVDRVTHAPAGAAAQFGWDVTRLGDLNGDGVPEYAVGAPFESTPPYSGNGVARIYSGASDALLYTFRGGADNVGLGSAVGHAGDVDNDGTADILVGGFLDSSVAPSAGMARVYSGRDGSVLRTVYGAAADDRMGSSCDTLEDINGDGHDDFFVGVAGTSGFKGSIWVYSGIDGSRMFVVDGTFPNERFGSSARAIGDVNGDRINDFVVGGPQWLPSTTGAGSARVCSGATGATIHSVYGDNNGDAFGAAVAPAGDVTGDGVPDFLVGAPRGRKNGLELGYSRVFSGVDAAIVHENVGLRAGDTFGRSVADAGDVNGDGVPDYLVGAPGTDTGNGVDSGAAYVFSGAHGGQQLQAFVGDTAGDQMGYGVAGLGDVSGDGRSDMLLGANLADVVAVSSGLARVLIGMPPAEPGYFATYGAGCRGSAGRLPRIGAGGRPGIGQQVWFSLRAAPASALAVLSVGPAKVSLGLAAVGLPGCTLLTAPSMVLPFATGASGAVGFAAPIPASSSLVGNTVYFQWVVADAAANPLGAVLSDGLLACIGR